MRTLALAGLAPFFVVANIGADEPAAKSVLSTRSSQSDDQKAGPDKGPIGKQYCANPGGVRSPAGCNRRVRQQVRTRQSRRSA